MTAPLSEMTAGLPLTGGLREMWHLETCQCLTASETGTLSLNALGNGRGMGAESVTGMK